MGNGYPLETLRGKNVVLIGGGFGFSTLRALTNFMLDDSNRECFEDITVVYGARTPGFLLYKADLETWQKRSDIDLHVTVDQVVDGWDGKVGLVPTIVKEAAPIPKETIALVCGPPVMIKYTLPVLQDLGFCDEQMLLSLEMRMKCGIGMCGRCNLASKYVCRDGPVFSRAVLNGLTTDEPY